MVEKIVYFDCSLCVIDFITISALRRFLFDFLIDCKNRKSAKRLYMQQPLIQRITLAFIQPFLKRNASIFHRYQLLYVIIIYTLLPQYIILLVCNVTLGIKSLYVLALFAFVKLFIAFLIRFQTDSSLVSRYRKK